MQVKKRRKVKKEKFYFVFPYSSCTGALFLRDEETRKRAKDLISSVARKILGENLYKVEEELRQMGYPLDDLYRYALWSGTLPPKEEIGAFHSFLINVLEGKRWRDPFMGRFAGELFTEETLKRWKNE